MGDTELYRVGQERDLTFSIFFNGNLPFFSPELERAHFSHMELTYELFRKKITTVNNRLKLNIMLTVEDNLQSTLKF